MLTRFTDTDANKAALVSTVPVKRLAKPEEDPLTLLPLSLGKRLVHDWRIYPGGW